jgi:hypothetical protein
MTWRTENGVRNKKPLIATLDRQLAAIEKTKADSQDLPGNVHHRKGPSPPGPADAHGAETFDRDAEVLGQTVEVSGVDCGPIVGG